MHEVFKNDKVLFKGSSHLPCGYHHTDRQGPKVARTENSTLRDESRKKMYGLKLKSPEDGVDLR